MPAHQSSLQKLISSACSYHLSFFLAETLIKNYRHGQWPQNLSNKNDWNLLSNMIQLKTNDVYLIVFSRELDTPFSNDLSFHKENTCLVHCFSFSSCPWTFFFLSSIRSIFFLLTRKIWRTLDRNINVFLKNLLCDQTTYSSLLRAYVKFH